MFRTGSWKISDLIKYLASIKDDLLPEEMRKLRQTEVFTQEEYANTSGLKGDGTIDKSPAAPSGSQKRFVAADLYEPTESNRELGLPLLNWGTSPRWNSHSHEG